MAPMATRNALAELSMLPPIERELQMRSRECGIPIRGTEPPTRTQWNSYCSALRAWTRVAIVIALLGFAYLGHSISPFGGAALALCVVWIAVRSRWMLWIAAIGLLLQQYLL
jgi:hypothetical protein